MQQHLPVIDTSRASDPGTHTLQQDQVDAYAELSGDFNPLHLDLTEAQKGPFGELVVHGVVPAGLMVDRWAQQYAADPHESRTVDLGFLSPLRPNEPFSMTNDSNVGTFGLVCEAGSRRITTLVEVSDVSA